MQCTKSIFLHQACNSVLTARLSAISQVLQNSRSTIDPVASDEGCTNELKKPRILLPSIRYWMIKPCVVASASDAEERTHHLDAELVPMHLNEFVRLPDFAWNLVHGHGDHLHLQV